MDPPPEISVDFDPSPSESALYVVVLENSTTKFFARQLQLWIQVYKME